MVRENIGGIEVDVTKAIGNELAKIAVASISQERMDQLVEYCMNELVSKKDSWGWDNKDSDLTKIVYYAFKDLVSKRIAEIVCSEKYVKDVNAVANNIVTRASQSAEEYMTIAIAKRMCIDRADFCNLDRESSIENTLMETASKVEDLWKRRTY